MNISHATYGVNISAPFQMLLHSGNSCNGLRSPRPSATWLLHGPFHFTLLLMLLRLRLTLISGDLLSRGSVLLHCLPSCLPTVYSFLQGPDTNIGGRDQTSWPASRAPLPLAARKKQTLATWLQNERQIRSVRFLTLQLKKEKPGIKERRED